MKKIIIILIFAIVIIFGLFLLSGNKNEVNNSGDVSAGSTKLICSGKYNRPSGETSDQVLRSFFSYLSDGGYCDAAAYYGGSYDELVRLNTEIKKSDYGNLWQAGCERNGFNCLAVLDVVGTKPAGDDTEFIVHFQNKDGSLFGRGSAKQEFSVIVGREKDDYFVKSLPPRVQ